MPNNIWRRNPAGRRFKAIDLVPSVRDQNADAKQRIVQQFFEADATAGTRGANTLDPIWSTGAGVLVNPAVGNAPDTSTPDPYIANVRSWDWDTYDPGTTNFASDNNSWTWGAAGMETQDGTGPGGAREILLDAKTVRWKAMAAREPQYWYFGNEQTIEFYFRTTQSAFQLYTHGTGNKSGVYYTGGNLILSDNTGSPVITTAVTINDGLPHHFEISLTAAGVFRIFIDGVPRGSHTITGDTVLTEGNQIYVGGNRSRPGVPTFIGGISLYRCTDLVARHSAGFTPPRWYEKATPATRPVVMTSKGWETPSATSADYTNTLFMTWVSKDNTFIEANSVVDKRLTWTIAGGTGMSVSYAALGATNSFRVPIGGSAYYYEYPDDDLWNLNGEQFTFDMRCAVINNVTHPYPIFDCPYFSIEVDASGKLIAKVNDNAGTPTTYVGTTTNLSSSFKAIQLCVSATTVYLFLDGVLEVSGARPSTAGTGRFAGFARFNAFSTTAMYFDEVRLLKGKAEHTAGYTVPTTRFARSAPLGAASNDGANTTDAFTQTAAGKVATSGAGANTTTQTSSGAGSVSNTGAGANTTTQSSVGSGVVGSTAIIGNGANTVAAFTSVGTGYLINGGVGANTPTQTSVGAGKVSTGGAGASTVAAFTSVGAGLVFLASAHRIVFNADNWINEGPTFSENDFTISDYGIRLTTAQKRFGESALEFTTNVGSAQLSRRNNGGVSLVNGVMASPQYSWTLEMSVYLPTGYTAGRLFGIYGEADQYWFNKAGHGYQGDQLSTAIQIGSNRDIQFDYTNDRTDFEPYDFKQTAVATGTNVLNLDAWNSVTVVVDRNGGNQRLRISANGTLVYDAALTWGVLMGSGFKNETAPPASYVRLGCDAFAVSAPRTAPVGVIVDAIRWTPGMALYPGAAPNITGAWALPTTSTGASATTLVEVRSVGAGNPTVGGAGANTPAAFTCTGSGRSAAVSIRNGIGEAALANNTSAGVGSFPVKSTTDAEWVNTELMIQFSHHPRANTAATRTEHDESGTPKYTATGLPSVRRTYERDAPGLGYGLSYRSDFARLFGFGVNAYSTNGTISGAPDQYNALKLQNGIVEGWVRRRDTSGQSWLMMWATQQFFFGSSAAMCRKEMTMAIGFDDATGAVLLDYPNHPAALVWPSFTAGAGPRVRKYTLVGTAGDVPYDDWAFISVKLETNSIKVYVNNVLKLSYAGPWINQAQNDSVYDGVGLFVKSDGEQMLNIKDKTTADVVHTQLTRNLWHSMRWVTGDPGNRTDFPPRLLTPPLATTLITTERGDGYMESTSGDGAASLKSTGAAYAKLAEFVSRSGPDTTAWLSGANTLAAFVSVGAGTLGLISIVGIGANTTVAFTNAAAGTVSNTGAGTNTTTQTSLGAGAVAVRGDGANTTTQTSVGEGVTASGPRVGDGANTTDYIASLGAGVVPIAGVGVNTPFQTSLGAGVVAVRGTGENQTLVTSAGAGTFPVFGTSSTTLVTLFCQGTGTVSNIGNSSQIIYFASYGEGTVVTWGDVHVPDLYVPNHYRTLRIGVDNRALRIGVDNRRQVVGVDSRGVGVSREFRNVVVPPEIRTIGSRNK